MSSSYVRSKVRQWCGEIAAATSVPFYDTVNVSVNPAQPVWFTVVFTAEMHEGTFCRSDFIEMGFITLVIFARPGIGDTAAIAAVEVIVPAIMAKTDSKLSLINFEPLDEETFGSADKDYRVSVAVNYRLSL